MPREFHSRGFPNDVFDPANVKEKPEKSRFFLGQTVLHLTNQQFYTVCDLSNYEGDVYGLWQLGFYCAIPTHQAEGSFLEAVSQIEPPLTLDFKGP